MIPQTINGIHATNILSDEREIEFMEPKRIVIDPMLAWLLIDDLDDDEVN